MSITKNAVDEAVSAWTGAPLHVKTMAGAYMRPILIALQALSAQATEQQTQIDALKDGPNGNHS